MRLPKQLTITWLVMGWGICTTLITQAQSFYDTSIVVGAARLEQYVPLLKGKKLALAVNHTSQVKGQHLVDILRAQHLDIVKIFAPEHGFRGTAGAGELIASGKDASTGIEVVSLSGKHKKPDAADLADVDMVVFDMQDVGVRFYTYLSTLHYIMEACAEHNKFLVILDRPNPNGFYVDGPVLEPELKSFVGMHPIPVVHGCTFGELACMINEEGWLKGGVSCNFEVIPCLHYTHRSYYELPVRPSPNLPNMKAVYLYPSLCLFEGTPISVGRGTDIPFQVLSCPKCHLGSYRFTPQSNTGAPNPPFKNETCHGTNLSALPLEKLRKIGFSLSYILDYYNDYQGKFEFFNKDLFFDKLAGTTQLRRQIAEGKNETAIKAVWQADLKHYKTMRKRYLLYPDFE